MQKRKVDRINLMTRLKIKLRIIKKLLSLIQSKRNLDYKKKLQLYMGTKLKELGKMVIYMAML